MSKTVWSRLHPWLLLLALGCDGGEPTRFRYDPANPPLALDDGLLYAQNDDSDPLTIDLFTDRPRARRQPLATPVVARAQGASKTTAVLLTAGLSATDERGKPRAAQPSQVVVVDRQAKLGERTLHAAYGALALSEDGRFALAYAPTGNLALSNALEVVDLTAPDKAPTVVNLELDGRAPSSFVFSPKLGFSRRIVVIPFGGTVMLLDLEHPEHGAIAVPLAAQDLRTLTPQRVLFAGDQIFVQASNSTDVLVLELLAAADTRHGFRVVPSLLTTSGVVRDLALVGSGEQLRLTALTTQVELLDPRRGSATAIAAAGSFSRLLPFEGSSPVDTVVARRGLLFAPSLTRVGFVELGGDESWAGRTIELVELGEALTDVVPLANHKLAIGLHASGRLSVIKLEARTVDPYRLEGALSSLLLDEDAQRARVWLVTGGSKLGTIDLLARIATEVPIVLDQVAYASELDGRSVAQAGRGLLLVPGARRRIAVLHGSEVGRVTLIDADAPTRENARELAGFFLADLFD